MRDVGEVLNQSKASVNSWKQLSKSLDPNGIRRKHGMVMAVGKVFQLGKAVKIPMTRIIVVKSVLKLG
jgi:hypothetical protein